MKKILFLFIVLSIGANAQIQISAKKCYYDGRNIRVSLKVENTLNTPQQIEIDASDLIVQLPYNPRGDEFEHRYNGNLPDAFILSYVNDTLIKEFKFYTLGIPEFVILNIPAKSYIEREYIVYVIGDTTRSLLDQKSKDVSMQFCLVFKRARLNGHAMTKKVRIKYKQ